MASIFDRIFRYRQSDGRTPWEDYFTEILADVLEKHEALGTAFVRYLTSRDDIQRIDIQTQRSFGDAQRRPDVYVTAHDRINERHLLVVENKIDALEGVNQLADYMRILEQEEDVKSRTLVYITRCSRPDFGEELHHVKFKHLYWFEVYDWIRDWVKYSEVEGARDGELVIELLSLMEDWSMDGDITAGDLRAAITYHMSLQSGNALLEVANQAWDMSEIEAALGDITGKWSYNYYECWEYSPKIIRFGVRIGIGYWFDRSDQTWDAARLELPSAAVAIYQRGGPPPAKLRSPSRAWTKGPVEGFGGKDLWVRTLDEIPCYGSSLSEHYRQFFLNAFAELKDALGRR